MREVNPKPSKRSIGRVHKYLGVIKINTKTDEEEERQRRRRRREKQEKKIKKENCFERKESHDEQRLCFGTRNSQLALIISILYPFNFVSFISQNANM